MSTPFRILPLVALFLASCAAHVRSQVVKQAAFDHDCPQSKIVVVQEDTSIFAYKLDVCGRRRKYRDFGNEKQFQFVDVTDGVPAVPGSSK